MSNASYAKLNNRVIYKRITDKRALLLRIDALDLMDQSSGERSPRMRITCYDYDAGKSAGEKVTSELNFFIPLPKFLCFCHDVLSGVYAHKQREELKKDTKANPVYFTHYGGSHGPPDIISTRLTLVNSPSPDARFAFLATAGPGKHNNHGGIVSVPGTKPTQSIFISMPDQLLKEMCLIGQAYVEQYIAMDLQHRLVYVRKNRDAYIMDAEGYEDE